MSVSYTNTCLHTDINGNLILPQIDDITEEELRDLNKLYTNRINMAVKDIHLACSDILIASAFAKDKYISKIDKSTMVKEVSRVREKLVDMKITIEKEDDNMVTETNDTNPIEEAYNTVISSSIEEDEKKMTECFELDPSENKGDSSDDVLITEGIKKIHEYDLTKMTTDEIICLLREVQSSLSQIKHDERIQHGYPMMDEIFLKPGNENVSNKVLSSKIHQADVIDYLSFPLEEGVTDHYLLRYANPSKIWRTVGNYFIAIASYCEELEKRIETKSELERAEKVIKSILGIE